LWNNRGWDEKDMVGKGMHIGYLVEKPERDHWKESRHRWKELIKMYLR
jgi:hypothetical protein